MTNHSVITIMLLAGLTNAVRAECDVSVSENTVDYGKLSRNEINNQHSDVYTLDEREVRVNAICSEPQAMAFFISDDSGLKRFRFGNSGDLLLSAQRGLLDGKPVELGKTLTHGSFTPMQERDRRKILLLNNDGLLPVRNGEVPVGQQFSFVLHIRPELKHGLQSAQAGEDLLSSLTIQFENH